MSHTLLLLASESAPSASGIVAVIVGIVVGTISILAAIVQVVKMLTRMESKLDVAATTQAKHETRIEKHEERLNAVDVWRAEMRGSKSGAGGPSARHLALAAQPITDEDE
jgi:hypothetical protein